MFVAHAMYICAHRLDFEAGVARGWDMWGGMHSMCDVTMCAYYSALRLQHCVSVASIHPVAIIGRKRLKTVVGVTCVT